MKDLGRGNVLGVLVDAVDRDAAVERVIRAAHRPEPYRVTALAVHGVMTGAWNIAQRKRLNGFDLVVPDGQPVRWALNLMYRTALRSSVRGTDLALAVLDSAEQEKLSVFFYGSTEETLAHVVARVEERHPDLHVAGAMPSAFRAVDTDTQEVIAARIRDSGADLVFVGLGCPRQETFVSAMTGRIGVPLIAVGAAFDYFAGTLREPPRVVGRWGFEWAWRLALEPRRLWRRYVLLNPAYLALVTLQAAGLYRPAAERGIEARLERLDA